MRRPRAAVTTAVSAIVLFSGCSGAQPHEVSSASSAPVPAGSTPVGSTQEQLDQAFLTFDDLPPGWSVGPAGPTPQPDKLRVVDPPSCASLFETLAAAEPSVSGTTRFTATGIAPTLEEGLWAFDTSAEAAGVVDRVSEAIAQCPTTSWAVGTNRVGTMTAQPAAAPDDGGDAATAATLTFDGGSGDELGYHLVVAAVGPTVVGLRVGAATMSDAELAQVMRRAVAHVDAPGAG